MKNKLYQIRKAIGLTQAQAAKECGVCERTYRDLENGTISRADNQRAAEGALKARAKKRAREVLILANNEVSHGVRHERN